MSTGILNIFMLIKLLNKNKNYIIKNVMRFKFLIIKKFSGGVVGEPGFPTKLLNPNIFI
jgi:hypothetical protein